MSGLGEISLVRLSSEHDVGSFKCTDEELCAFLVEDALNYQSSYLANTTLVMVDGCIVAYFSLAADAINLDQDEKDAGGITASFASFPALKIARLATDARRERRGYGSHAVKFCVGLARHLNNEHRHDGIGCRFVTVDAYPSAEDWYTGFGFVRNARLMSKKRETVSMRLDAMPYKD